MFWEEWNRQEAYVVVRKFETGSKMKSIWTALKNIIYGDGRRGAGRTVWRVEVWDEMLLDKMSVTYSETSDSYFNAAVLKRHPLDFNNFFNLIFSFAFILVLKY